MNTACKIKKTNFLQSLSNRLYVKQATFMQTKEDTINVYIASCNNEVEQICFFLWSDWNAS